MTLCHVTGNGGYVQITVSGNAASALLAHGDVFPGSTVNTGAPYSGLYGSTVTPVTLIGDDCSQTQALSIAHTENFQTGQPAGSSAGWAGWSCLESGYPHVLGGGITPADATIVAQGPAKTGAAAIDGSSYPTYPNYTFPSGEEGWVVEGAGPTPPTGIYVVCGP